MKKFIIAIAILLAFSPIFAQDENTDVTTPKNSSDKQYTPVAGEIGLGMSLYPILSYVGNIFHGTNYTNPNYADFNANDMFAQDAIFAKYFLSDNMAVRVNIGFADYTFKNTAYVRDDAAFLADPLSNAKVVDIEKVMRRGYGIGVGIEMRRGSNRLQGIYGVDLNLFYDNRKYDFTYGNPMSADNPTPTTNDFGFNLINPGTWSRILKQYNGEQYGINLMPFVGFEYFIAPKISIGANTGIGISYYFDGQQKYSYETYDNAVIERTETNYPGDHSTELYNYNPYMNFYMMFHF